MEFKWDFARPLFAKLDRPDCGSWERWMCWYETAWAIMSQEGITEAKSMLDDTLVRLRLLVVCWLSHDFNGAVLSDAECSSLYWKEWADSIGIEPLRAAVTIADKEILQTLMVESRMSYPGICYDEEGIADVYSPYLEDFIDIDSQLAPLAVMSAAFNQRDFVLKVLSKGFGGDAQLFGSMYANYQSVAEEIDEQRDLLEQELEILERIYNQTCFANRKKDLQLQIDDARELLADKPATSEAIEQLRLLAMNDPFIFGDEASPERSNGCQWYRDGFSVVVRGEPEFNPPVK